MLWFDGEEAGAARSMMPDDGFCPTARSDRARCSWPESVSRPTVSFLGSAAICRSSLEITCSIWVLAWSTRLLEIARPKALAMSDARLGSVSVPVIVRKPVSTSASVDTWPSSDAELGGGCGMNLAAWLATAVVLTRRAIAWMFAAPTDSPPNEERSIETACGLTSVLDSYSLVLRASSAYEISGTTTRNASMSHFQRQRDRR